MAIREAVHAAGARVLEALLREVGVGRRDEPVWCPKCRMAMRSLGVRGKEVQTLLGRLRFERSRYPCPCCGTTCYPGDQELGVEGTCWSPGVQRQVARLGAKEPFREVAKDMAALAGAPIARKDTPRVSEKTGIPSATRLRPRMWGPSSRRPRSVGDCGPKRGDEACLRPNAWCVWATGRNG